MAEVAIVDERGKPMQPAPARNEADAFISMIERAARDPNVDIEKMERLYAMHEKMQAKAAREAFDDAMSDMQAELPVIEHTKKVTFWSKRLQQQVEKNTYTPWEDIDEQIRPIYTKYGFSLKFEIDQPDSGPVAVTCLVKRAGHSEATTIKLPPDMSGEKNPAQGVASAVSYGKRYSAGAALNLTTRGAEGQTEDDDGEKASNTKSAHAARKDGSFEKISDEMRSRVSSVEELRQWWVVIQCDNRFVAWPNHWKQMFKAEVVDAYREELTAREPA